MSIPLKVRVRNTRAIVALALARKLKGTYTPCCPLLDDARAAMHQKVIKKHLRTAPKYIRDNYHKYTRFPSSRSQKIYNIIYDIKHRAAQPLNLIPDVNYYYIQRLFAVFMGKTEDMCSMWWSSETNRWYLSNESARWMKTATARRAYTSRIIALKLFHLALKDPKTVEYLIQKYKERFCQPF